MRARSLWSVVALSSLLATLPLVDGEQSYGLKIFHSANDDHVILVQTGSAEELAPQAEYHVIVR